MVSATDILTWTSLSAAINNIQTPNGYLRSTLFGAERTLPTETIELNFTDGVRQIAPFVRKNGEAIMVKGRGRGSYTIEAPNIRLKMPFTPSELLWNRRGSTIYPNGATVQSAITEHIAEDLRVMDDMIADAEEWLCAQALTGTVTYDAAFDATEGDNFLIQYPKAAANTVVLAGTDVWDNAASDPIADIMAAKRRLEAAGGYRITRALLSQTAATAFMANAKIRTELAQLNMDAGRLTVTGNFDSEGLLFLGRIAGVPFYEYARSALNPNGVATLMIRDKYVEFVSEARNTGNVMVYAAIPDMDALQGQRFVAKRFAKSWTTPDPSAKMFLVHTRPLPFMPRPNSVYSLKVLA